MAKLSKDDLFDRVLGAIDRAGWHINILAAKQYPLEITIDKDGESENLRIYIWNISHGGKTRSEDEYRIQITGVTSLKITEDFKTLLLGWYDELGVFAAFDPYNHRTFGFSPSIQCSKVKLAEANAHGLSIQEKIGARGKEIVVTFAPDFIMQYIEDVYPNYHTLTPTTIAAPEKELVLRNPMDANIDPAALTRLPPERKKAVKTINENVRERVFQVYVRKIYVGSCAICGLQGNLTEAAHIVGVKSKGSDEPVNGVQLCRNHHKAYDLGLLAIKPDYTIVVNDKYVAALRKAGLDKELDKFLKDSRIGQKIALPSKSEDYPKKEYLEKNCASKGIAI